MTPRIAIVDDQAMMRTAFRTILESDGIEVVGEAGDGDAALSLVGATHPDVVLMDVRMPGRDGIDATRVLARSHPEVRVLVLTTFNDDDALFGALRAGAAGFVLKNAAPEEVVQAVRRVAAGDSVLDPTVAGRVFARLARTSAVPADAARFDRLTEREKDVLALITRGLTNSEIAEELYIGEATAKTHVSRALAKLEVRDRVQAVILAYELGFAPTKRLDY